MSDADIHFYFDPVCPFAWMTSKWVRMVQAQRAYTVDWRFISLRMINAAVDYDSHFPAGYEAGHSAGLKLLRVAARTRAEHGRDAVGPLYAALGARIFDAARRPRPGRWRVSRHPRLPRPGPGRGRAARRRWPTPWTTRPSTPKSARRPRKRSP